MVKFSHHAVNFGAKTLPFLCQIVTIKSGLVLKRDTFWCKNEIFHFSALGAKTLIFGANSRPLLMNCDSKVIFILKINKFINFWSGWPQMMFCLIAEVEVSYQLRICGDTSHHMGVYLGDVGGWGWKVRRNLIHQNLPYCWLGWVNLDPNIQL